MCPEISEARGTYFLATRATAKPEPNWTRGVEHKEWQWQGKPPRHHHPQASELGSVVGVWIVGQPSGRVPAVAWVGFFVQGLEVGLHERVG